MSEILVYSTPTCPYCDMAKDYLKNKGIEFIEIDVAADPTKAQEMIELSGQMGVPVIKIGNEIIIGFDKAKIDAVLESPQAQ